jgi:DNA polymerase-1
MIALIDGDIIAYRCSASCEPNKQKLEREPLGLAISRADELLYRICDHLAVDKYRVFLSGSENFRKVLDPNYKANRVQPKPEYLDSVRNLLIEEWDAEVCAGYEADDGLGIAASDDSIICSIDKDLRQIPGRHFDFVKNESFEIDAELAVRCFYTQMLVGDRSDNVDGIEGIGPVKAGRILDGKSPQEMEASVYDCYRGAGKSRDKLLSTYRLLRILRSPAELEEIEDIIRQGKGKDLTEASRFPDTYGFPNLDGQ